MGELRDAIFSSRADFIKKKHKFIHERASESIAK